jgi:signal transduction histidine kinase
MNQQLRESYHRMEKKVEERTLELQQQNLALEQTLQQLQTTQEQLITQEKLASLGQITAGIAHEIKNPLNFVINFANVIIQRIHESPTPDLQTILQCAQKVTEHGERIADIIHAMLQHSGTNNGRNRVPCNINKLVQEYVNLAYYGLRTQHEYSVIHFEPSYAPELDHTLLPCIPSDLSRAFLNILQNACYAVHKKHQHAPTTYRPTVWVTTECQQYAAVVKIRDNGPGIPPDIQERVFEPFVTGKPVGEGTGLGLSIAHQIVTQEHNGTLEVISAENGAEFIMTLPYHDA